MNRQKHRLMPIPALILLVLLITGCQAEPIPVTAEPVPVTASPKPEEVVLQSVEKFRAGDLDGSLAYFADDAVVKLVGLPPGQPDTFTGKQAIRSWWDDLLKQNFDLKVEVLEVEGDQVMTRTLTWVDDTRALGVAPMEANEVYVIKDGKIQSETWTLTEESSARLQAAIAAAQSSPTPAQATDTPAPPTSTTTSPATDTPIPDLTLSPPTATFQPEVLAVQGEDIAGIWRINSFGDNYTLQFLADGTYNVGFEDDLDAITDGIYEFTSSELHFINDGACPGSKAVYNVYVTKQEDQPVKLRFLLMGEDGCAERKDALAGKTLKPEKP